MSTDAYIWKPWHLWTPGSCTQIDGNLKLPGGACLPLDVWALGDEDMTREMAMGAPAVWLEGGVRFEVSGGLFNLIVPSDVLTETLVTEAIGRFVFAAYGTTRVVIEDAVTGIE